MATKHNHTILYAEDDPDDVFMIQQAFETHDPTTQLIHATNGLQALELLSQLRVSNNLPCLIILDINMPVMDGKETLMRLKQTEEYKNIPVVLFTTSSSDGDKAFAQKWDAAFITKPLVYAKLEELANNFIHLCSDEVARR